MVVELLKTLVEEPEKVTKAGLILFRASLAVILANEVYEYLYGQYEIISLNNISEWKDAFLSGRVLIGLFIFYVVHRVFFDILESIFFIPVRWGVKALRAARPNKREGDYLVKLLNYLEIVDADFESRSIKPGKNIGIVEVIIDNTEEVEQEVFKQSLIRELYNLNILFSFVYFFILSEEIHSNLICIVIIILNIGFYFLYIGIKGLFEFFYEKGSKVGESIKHFKIHEKVINTLNNFRDKGVFESVEIKDEKNRIDNLTYKGYKYRVSILSDDKVITADEINYRIEWAIERNERLLIISNSELNNEILDLINEHKNSVKYIVYKNEEYLEKQIKKLFSS